MIKQDQPNQFDSSVIAAVSSAQDGQMQHGWNETEDEVNLNRQAFLSKVGLKVARIVFLRVRYVQGASYDIIKDVDNSQAGYGMTKLEGEATDCLVTNTPGLGLFLPVADCGATIVHDEVKQVLALAHLGRHSTAAHLASKLVGHLEEKYNSNPKDLKVWISPSIKATSYIMKTVDFTGSDKRWENFCQKVDGGFSVDVQGFNKSLFIESGVNKNNIFISPVNTATDENYWSHFTQVTINNKPAPPRFAVVAALNTV